MKNYIENRLKEKFNKDEISSLLRILKEDISGFDALDENQTEAIIARLLADEPVQYITGIAPFYGYFFNVNSSVLIPRPETEELVYVIDKYIKSQMYGKANIIDIGSGSGCIPITLNLLSPDTKLTSIDVSTEAIITAKSNNEKLFSNVSFLPLNFLDESEWLKLDKSYDIIVSNPPYIPNQEKALMHNNVLDFEPHIALFVEDEDPLLFYRTIYNFSLTHLNEKGRVFLECNEFNAKEVKDLFSQSYFTEIIADMQGKDRIVIAY